MATETTDRKLSAAIFEAPKLTEPPIAPSSALPVRPAADSSSDAATNFDIVSTYHELLASDPDLTKPVVAIKALIALLTTVPSSTTHETIEILKAGSERLKASVRNPLPLAAGTHLFLQYILHTLTGQHGNFEAIREHLVRNGQLFAQRAIEARNGVAEKGWRFVLQGSTVMTHGASRAVIGLLEKAQKERPGTFNVVYVTDEDNPAQSERVVQQLRDCGIPTSAIKLHSVLQTMRDLKPRIDMLFLGAEVITQDGGIISRMGTSQIAQLAKVCNIDTYVCGETHKFSGYMPCGNGDVGFTQKLQHFTKTGPQNVPEDPVDYTVCSIQSKFAVRI